MKASKGGAGGRSSKGRNYRDSQFALKRRAEKRDLEEQRLEEEIAAQRKIDEASYWQPVDKADRKHKLKLYTQQKKAMEAHQNKVLNQAAYAEEFY
eukprot:CAMPEP_0170460724 /NCGR_PEP_ID=MMETSP0123-20130129/6948_1 /TAXON_ID=182087 /ORGANISM="Favella ehrenbergii, Strain Fehren 1" /LENGTH=95 /DNA_ID=CAMNT_0010725667 /DNA_START=39 /DNA_END=326 /DNA_ORIENTATION=+